MRRSPSHTLPSSAAIVAPNPPQCPDGGGGGAGRPTPHVNTTSACPYLRGELGNMLPPHLPCAASSASPANALSLTSSTPPADVSTAAERAKIEEDFYNARQTEFVGDYIQNQRDSEAFVASLAGKDLPEMSLTRKMQDFARSTIDDYKFTVFDEARHLKPLEAEDVGVLGLIEGEWVSYKCPDEKSMLLENDDSREFKPALGTGIVTTSMPSPGNHSRFQVPGKFVFDAREYIERLSFARIPGSIRNRGGAVEQFCGAVMYNQSIKSVWQEKDGDSMTKKYQGIHEENGMLLSLTKVLIHPATQRTIDRDRGIYPVEETDANYRKGVSELYTPTAEKVAESAAKATAVKKADEAAKEAAVAAAKAAGAAKKAEAAKKSGTAAKKAAEAAKTAAVAAAKAAGAAKKAEETAKATKGDVAPKRYQDEILFVVTDPTDPNFAPTTYTSLTIQSATLPPNAEVELIPAKDHRPGMHDIDAGCFYVPDYSISRSGVIPHGSTVTLLGKPGDAQLGKPLFWGNVVKKEAFAAHKAACLKAVRTALLATIAATAAEGGDGRCSAEDVADFELRCLAAIREAVATMVPAAATAPTAPKSVGEDVLVAPNPYTSGADDHLSLHRTMGGLGLKNFYLCPVRPIWSKNDEYFTRALDVNENRSYIAPLIRDALYPYSVRPDLRLYSALRKSKVVDYVKFTLDTDAQGGSGSKGGIVNIPFIDRFVPAVRAQFTMWLQCVDITDELSDDMRKTHGVGGADGGAGPKRIYIHQLQYEQQVFFEFGFGDDGGTTRWPHIQVNTLRKAADIKTYGLYANTANPADKLNMWEESEVKAAN